MNDIDVLYEKITVEDLEKFEIKYNVKLPKQYKNFLVEFNGGYPQKSGFEISKEEGKSLVNRFYGIGDMKCNLGQVFEYLDGELPEGFISIGDDPGGNEICIGVNSEYYEKIYFWAHDSERDEEMSNMFFLANDFDSFFEGLEDCE